MKDIIHAFFILTWGLLLVLWCTCPFWILPLFFFTWGDSNLAYAIGHTILVILGMLLFTVINKIVLIACVIKK